MGNSWGKEREKEEGKEGGKVERERGGREIM